MGFLNTSPRVHFPNSPDVKSRADVSPNHARSRQADWNGKPFRVEQGPLPNPSYSSLHRTALTQQSLQCTSLRPNSWGGDGVSPNICTPQRLNSGTVQVSTMFLYKELYSAFMLVYLASGWGTPCSSKRLPVPRGGDLQHLLLAP